MTFTQAKPRAPPSLKNSVVYATTLNTKISKDVGLCCELQVESTLIQLRRTNGITYLFSNQYLTFFRDLQGVCYMCMCVSMAFGFLSLGILQLSPGFRGQICAITGKSLF